jgi:protein phosphatase
MGGHRGGDVAARSAIDGIQRAVRERRDAIDRVEPDPGAAHQLAEVAAGAVRRAGREVNARASSDPELAGMGCTATVVLVAGNTCAMAHVGDSRLYLLRDGAVHRLSRDHTITAELVRNGALDESDAPDHPYAHVLTRALGVKSSVEVETSCFGLRSGDRLIVCSDGLSDYLLHDGWLAPLAAGAALDGLPRQLVDFALARGGHDNVTVVAIDVGAEAACAGRP